MAHTSKYFEPIFFTQASFKPRSQRDVIVIKKNHDHPSKHNGKIKKQSSVRLAWKENFLRKCTSTLKPWTQINQVLKKLELYLLILKL